MLNYKPERIMTRFAIFLFFAFASIQPLAQDMDFDLNTDVKYRTIEGVEGGNFLDVKIAPELALPGIFGTRFDINIPYNLSTNEIRKIDTKFGNSFKYAYLGTNTAYVMAGAVEAYSQGYTGMIVNNYNNRLDENNMKSGAYAGVNVEGFSINAMTNNIESPEVFTGSMGIDLPFLANFKLNVSGGYDLNPDNNKDTKESAGAFAAELYSALELADYNYFYVVGGMGQILSKGNGQLGLLGARFGTESFFFNLSGSLMRLGPGFEWGFFDAFYEKDRKIGFNKADSLFAKYPKSSGGTNFYASIGYKNEDPSDLKFSLEGFYFTNYAGTDLNEFNAAVSLYLPRTLLGEEGELLSARLILKTKAFQDITGLINQIKQPDTRTVITLDAPIVLLPNVYGLGALAFVLNYSWSFTYDNVALGFIPQKNLLYGFRLISNI